MGKQEKKESRYRIKRRQSDPVFKKAQEELSKDKEIGYQGEGETPEKQRQQIERIRQAHSRLKRSMHKKRR